jgi:hypothetical protein
VICSTSTEEQAHSFSLQTHRDFYVLHRTARLEPPEPSMVFHGSEEELYF